MIANDRQYQVTVAEARKFEEALQRVEEQEGRRHPLHQKAMRDSIAGQLQDLRSEITEYEALRDGRVRVLEVGSLAQLPDILIGARVAAGLTQAELAERLGVRRQQVQHDEQTRYASASLARLMRVCEVLGVAIHQRALLPVAGAVRSASPGHQPAGVSV